MRKLLTTTALALLLCAPVAMTLHAQDGGSSGGGSSTGGGTAGGGSTGGDAGSAGDTGGSPTGGAGNTDSNGSAGGDASTTGGATGGTAGTATGGSDGDTGGTTGIMTTTPGAKTDDATGTGAATAAVPSTWGDATGGDLVGKTIYGSNGEEIGEVEDLVSRGTGSGPEALVGVGGFLGIGERNVTIPLTELQMEGDRLTTSMTKESLGAMQPYDQTGYSPWDRSRALGAGSSAQ